MGELNRGFSVSVQSLHESTLKAIKRDNLGINDLEKIFKLCHINSVNSYTEVILGLPYETKETFIQSNYDLSLLFIYENKMEFDVCIHIVFHCIHIYSYTLNIILFV